MKNHLRKPRKDIEGIDLSYCGKKVTKNIIYGIDKEEILLTINCEKCIENGINEDGRYYVIDALKECKKRLLFKNQLNDIINKEGD